MGILLGIVCLVVGWVASIDECNIAGFVLRPMRDIRGNARGDGLIARPQRWNTSRSDPNAHFPRAPVPIVDAFPGRVCVHVLPVKDGANYTARCSAVRTS